MPVSRAPGRFPGMLPLAAAVLSMASLSCSDRHDLTTRPTLGVESPATKTDFAAPDPDAQPGFYPLATGNKWSYTQEVVVQLVDVPDPPPPERYELSIGIEIVLPATIDGREYLGEVTTIGGSAPPLGTYLPVRQDATGLYEWTQFIPGAGGVSAGRALRIAVPAGRSPAEHAALAAAALRLEGRIAAVEASLGRRPGAAKMNFPPTRTPSERTRLQYPLEAKSQWQISEDRRFNASARVIGQETLNLPPGPQTGYRIAVSSDRLGPSDSITWWYGSKGFLQEVTHMEIPAVDNSGREVGRYLYDMRQWLTDYEIPPPHDVPVWPPRHPKP